MKLRLQALTSAWLFGMALVAAPLMAHAQSGDQPTSPVQGDADHMSYGREADNVQDQIKSYNNLLQKGENGLSVYQNTGGPRFATISAADQVASMGAGINIIGGYDAYWDGGTTRFTDGDIQAVAAAGFKTIRVPLFAFKHIADGQGNLDPAYLKRIDHIVDLATANHLNIILDEHNYEECSKNVDDCGTLLSNVWYDLALRYQTAPNNVIFELLNEPNGQLDAAVWNGWLPDLIAQVRQFNPSRNIIVGPTMWNSIDQLDNLKLPADDHIIVTFHYYNPMLFTHQGASWAGDENMKARNVRWTGDAQQMADLNAAFDKAAAWGKANNRPMFLGEYGTYGKFNDNMDDRVAWTRAVSKAADSRGFARAYWYFEDDGGFGVYDKRTNAWVEPIKNALINP